MNNLEKIVLSYLVILLLGFGCWESQKWIKEDIKYHDSLLEALIQCQGKTIEQDTMYQDYLLDVKEGKQE